MVKTQKGKHEPAQLLFEKNKKKTRTCNNKKQKVISGQILEFIYLLLITLSLKNERVGGFSKILRNFQSGSWQMLTSDYKVGGWGKKRPKTCLRNI